MKWSDVFRKRSPLDVESPPELNYYTRSAIFRSLIRYVSSFFFVLLLFPYSIIARKRKNPIVSENYIVTKNATERIVETVKFETFSLHRYRVEE